MRRAGMLRILIAGIALAGGAGAQTAGTFTVSGRVVNSVTGEPVPRAALTLYDEDSRHVEATTRADAEGNFVFAGLPAGKYPLSATKRGFRSAYYDEHDDFNSAIVTGPGQDTQHLLFQLGPGAVLRGVVTADGGDPVEGATVMLFRAPSGGSGQKLVQLQAASSDDTGAYEFSDLDPGSYYVAVNAAPWYAQHGHRRDGETNELDVVYPITFFDSTSDESAASPVNLTPGAREEADISMHAVPAVHLRMAFGVGNREPIELRQMVFGSAVDTEQVQPAPGVNEHDFIASPGRYEVQQGDPPRVAEVEATGNADVPADAGTPTMTVSGTLRWASGETPEDASVTLTAEDVQRDPLQTNARKGHFEFDAVLPGRWRLGLAQATAGNTATVMSITADGKTAGGDEIVVGDHPLKIAANVAKSEARVEGFARKDGKPAAGVMILLVPNDPRSYEALVRRDQSDSDGSFSLRNVAAGQYTVIAIEQGWTLDWKHRDAIARFLPAGLAVTVGGPDGAVKLPAPVAAQAR